MSLTTSDSRSCRGFSSSPFRMLQRTLRPLLPLRDSLSPVSKRPKRVVWEFDTALPQSSAPPVSGWPVTLARRSGPFAPPALAGLITTTNPSAPASRIGTLPSAGPPPLGSPLASRRRFPCSTQEPAIGITPPLHRLPPANRQALAALDPRRWYRPWFRQHLNCTFDASSAVYLRSSSRGSPDGLIARLFQQRSPPQPLS
ncbi:hypothetical protein ABIA00_003253 [Bradyrhizobium ottawaense]